MYLLSDPAAAPSSDGIELQSVDGVPIFPALDLADITPKELRRTIDSYLTAVWGAFISYHFICNEVY